MRNKIPQTNPSDPANFATWGPEGPETPSTHRPRQAYSAVLEIRDNLGFENGKTYPSTRGPSHPWPKVAKPKPFKI